MPLPHRGTRLTRRFGRCLALAAVAAAMVLGPAGGPVLAAADGPVLDRNFPDPDVVRVGRTYHAYATNGDGKNIQHATSTDLVR
ncbi:hypothetical protein ACFY7H_02635 [Streptomyces sp. NPDC012794]|uniref:hypothetical protein n=1 Tax=Streptomyces sp. NPDC012794 TaxID=3364850 RepID=UPI003695D437